MCKEFELHPHTDPVVLHVMISCAGKRIVIQLKIQVWHQFIQLIYKNNSQKKKTIKDYTVFGLEKKTQGWDGDQIKKIKENIFEIETIRISQEELI